MKRFSAFHILLVLLAALLLVSAFATGCGDDDDDDDDNDDDDTGDDDDDDDTDAPPDVEECLAEGRDWLAIAEGDRARDSFLCVLEQVPDHIEGNYGLVLANTVHLNDAIGIIVDYVMSVIDYGGPVGKYDEDDVINRLVELVISGLVLDRGQELADASDFLQTTKDPLYTHDGIPVILDFTTWDTMSGEFDRSFLSASESYARLQYGLFAHLLTVSLDMDISIVFSILSVDFEETMVGIGDVIDIIQLLLNDPGHPDFLKMDEEGLELFATLGLMLGDGFDEFLNTWTTIGFETDDQSDDVIGFSDLTGNGIYDPLEPYFLPYFGILTEDEMNTLFLLQGIATQLRLSFWDQTEKDLDPDNPNPLPLASLNPLLEMLGLPGFLPADRFVDVGAAYADPNPLVVRELVENLILLLDTLLPGSGQFEPPQ